MSDLLIILVSVVVVCALCCIAEALRHIIYGKDWWLSRLLNRVMCIQKGGEGTRNAR